MASCVGIINDPFPSVCVLHTCILIAELFAGFGGPLTAVVSHPLTGRVRLIVQGQSGWIQPVGDVQITSHTDNKTAACIQNNINITLHYRLGELTLSLCV